MQAATAGTLNEGQFYKDSALNIASFGTASEIKATVDLAKGNITPDQYGERMVSSGVNQLATAGLLKAGGASSEGGSPSGSASQTTIVKKVIIDEATHPESAQHALEAQKAGQPDVVTANRPGTTANRRDALQGKLLA